MRWHCIAKEAEGRTETVLGRATVAQPVRGVLQEHLEGLLVVTVLASRIWSGTQLVQVVTGNDFLLEADDGRKIVVRAADVVVRWGWLEARSTFAWSTLDRVSSLLPDSMQEKIAKTPLRPPAALRFRELCYPSGARFEARGLVRQETPSLGLPGTGFRGQAAVPTLTGAGGRLELRYIPPVLRHSRARATWPTRPRPGLHR